jgi:CheY-like chemotaxis protein
MQAHAQVGPIQWHLTHDTFALTIKPAMLSSAASVLVVDDDRDSLNALRAILEPLGLAIVTADNGEEAIKQLDRGLRPKLVLIDLMLPRVSGWDLLQYVRERPELRDIRTAVVTGFPRENLRVTADAVLHKPVNHDRLVSTVLKLIERDSPDTARPAV